MVKTLNPEFLPGDAEEFINLADSFDNLELAGLMFMPNINQDKVSHIKEIKDSVNLFNDMKAKRKIYKFCL